MYKYNFINPRKLSYALLITSLLSPTAIAADTKTLEQRIEALEKTLAAIRKEAAELKELRELDRQEVKEIKKVREEQFGYEDLTFSLAVDIDATGSKTSNNQSTSDLIVSKAEFGVKAAITEQLSSNVIFLYEEDTKSTSIDQATIYTLWQLLDQHGTRHAFSNNWRNKRNRFSGYI